MLGAALRMEDSYVTIMQIQPFYLYAVGGVKVRVASADAARGAAILERARKTSVPAEPLDYVAGACPRCGAQARVGDPVQNSQDIGETLLDETPGRPTLRRHCSSCGHSWRAARFRLDDLRSEERERLGAAEEAVNARDVAVAGESWVTRHFWMLVVAVSVAVGGLLLLYDGSQRHPAF